MHVQCHVGHMSKFDRSWNFLAFQRAQQTGIPIRDTTFALCLRLRLSPQELNNSKVGKLAAPNFPLSSSLHKFGSFCIPLLSGLTGPVACCILLRLFRTLKLGASFSFKLSRRGFDRTSKSCWLMHRGRTNLKLKSRFP